MGDEIYAHVSEEQLETQIAETELRVDAARRHGDVNRRESLEGDLEALQDMYHTKRRESLNRRASETQADAEPNDTIRGENSLGRPEISPKLEDSLEEIHDHNPYTTNSTGWSFDNPNNDASPKTKLEYESSTDPSRTSTSSSNQAFNMVSPPRLVSVTSRKRLGSDSIYQQNAKRATPSPAITGHTTPTTNESLELPDDPIFYKLMGGDPKEDLRAMRKEQEEQEEALRQRMEQEKADEKMARELAEEWGGGSANQAFSEDSKPRASFLTDSDFVDLRSDDSVDAGVEDPAVVSQGWPNHDGKEKLTRTYSWKLPKTEQDPERSAVSHGLPAWINAYDTVYPEVSGSFARESNTITDKISRTIKDAYTATSNWMGGESSTSNGYSGYNGYDPPLEYDGLFEEGPGGPPLPFGDYGVGSMSNPVDLDIYGTPAQSPNVLGRYSINPNDPHYDQLLEQYNQRVSYLTHDPTRTTDEIKALLDNIRPDEDLPPENREGTPEAMTYPLMEHQKLGLTWMKKQEDGSNKGGILADAMGLGKTIQALALIVSRRSSDPLQKTTLIVAPVALLKQWESEIQRKVKSDREHRLTSLVLHGAQRHSTWDKIKNFDVVLTTYGTLSNEFKRKEAIDLKRRENPNWRPTAKGDHLPLLDDGSKFYRVILDEAQCIKNKNTQSAKAASRLQALTRFCMTGTPMMNNVGELFSLIRFLRIKPYSEEKKFNFDFKPLLFNGSRQNLQDTAMQKLQALLSAVLLRRNKQSKIDGKPILDLPARTTESVHAVFGEEQNAFYRALESQTQLQFNRYLKAGTVGRNYSNILVLLLRLRQACCHPHLIKDFGQDGGVTNLTPEEMIRLARELAPDVVARIKMSIESNEQNALECPVCMDSAQNATIFVPCGHDTCSECFARISDPSSALADGVAEARNGEVKCPSCRGKILASKILDCDTFKKVHMLDEDATGLSIDPSGDSDSDSETDNDSDSEDDDEDNVDEKGNLRDFVVDDDASDDETTSVKAEVKAEVEDEVKAEPEDSDAEFSRRKNPFEKAKVKEEKKRKRSKRKGKAKEKRPFRTLAELKKEGMRNVKAKRKYMRRLQKDFVPSSKTEKCMEILDRVMENTHDNEKTIVFSQFTSFLDLLEIPIHERGWDYRRYDGSMSATHRNDSVIEFSEKANCRIMLVSLKAGNAGLNLVAASQVIILDPFWNPYIEEQAIDRAHRIGQMRPVQVHRILIEDTVEDRILKLQEQKRRIIEGALDEKASQNISRLGQRELAYLFGVAPST